MLGKIVKTVFLNKEARDAMDKRDAVLQRKASAKEGAGKSESLAEAAESAAREAESADLAGNLRDKANATDLDRATIQEAIASAHQELVESGELPPRTALASSASAANASGRSQPKQDHGELVKSAMLIYKQKQKVLDDLDPDSKKKLRMMAKTVFGDQIKE